jgi:hypothetical protein
VSRYKYERLFLFALCPPSGFGSTRRPQEIYSFLPPSPGMLLREPMRGTVIVAGKVRGRPVSGNRLATDIEEPFLAAGDFSNQFLRSAIFVLEEFHATPPLLLARLTRLLTFVSRQSVAALNEFYALTKATHWFQKRGHGLASQRMFCWSQATWLRGILSTYFFLNTTCSLCHRPARPLRCRHGAAPHGRPSLMFSPVGIGRNIACTS